MAAPATPAAPDIPFNWALIGPGRIAHQFAGAVAGIAGARLAAVHGRDAGRAAAFAAEWARAGPMRVEMDLARLLADPTIHAVYIATPHAFHAEAVRACLQAGKPVLCEKPLTPNHTQAAELVALARERRVFLMEAVWTRFLPLYGVVGEWLQQGLIGRPIALQSTFCFPLPFDPQSRGYDPLQAGGALLDIGIYNLTMTRWALRMAHGACPPLRGLQAKAVIGPTGVDHRLSAMLEFADGAVSQFVCGFDTCADNGFRISGERGSIVIPAQFWRATTAELRVGSEPPVGVERALRVNGFEAEIEAAMAAIRRGEIEHPVISHTESLVTLQWMDQIRALVGVHYPFAGG